MGVNRVASLEYFEGRFAELEPQLSQLTATLRDLGRVKARFSDLEATYQAIQALHEQVGADWGQVAADWARYEEQIGAALTAVQTAISELRQESEQIQASFRAAMQELAAAFDSLAQQLHTQQEGFRAELDQASAQTRQDLEAFGASFDSLAKQLRGQQREFEQEQFRKLDDLAVTLKLLGERQRAAEGDTRHKLEELGARARETEGQVSGLETALEIANRRARVVLFVSLGAWGGGLAAAVLALLR